MSEPEFDENGVENPQGYLFGKIPYYSNRFAPDGTIKGALKPYLYVTPFILAMHWQEIKDVFFNW